MTMRNLFAWGLSALPIAAVVALVGFATLRPLTVLPRQGPAPGFALTDQDGRPLTSEDLRGSVVLYSFIAGCQPPCAPVAPLLHQLQARLADLGTAGPPVRLVTIAVDPAATPDLRATAAMLGADPARWTLASGEPARLKQIVGTGFGVFYGPAAGGAVAVDPALVLVDGWGLVRADYRAPLPPADQVLRDLRLVTDEARQSTGLARYAYEAAHLFACYPR
jgi:protein SCO1/2